MTAAPQQFAQTLRHIRALAGEPPGQLADVQLLERFARHRDDTAFSELVRRHGPLVLDIARRWRTDRHEAEDVFQSTFLALARQAARLGRRVPLNGWLYTVAFRLARKSQARAVRRTWQPLAPGILPPSPIVDPLTDISGRELLQALDEELARLPERYRLPLLLCGIEGLPRAEAATRLGWSLGMLRGRLERGRGLLRQRLEARGLTVPAVLASLLAVHRAVVPSTLAAATVQLALKVSPAAWAPASAVVLAVVLFTAVGVGTFVPMASRERERPEVFLQQGNPPVAHAPGSPQNPQRFDPNGDPLPNGAMFRFGSARWRHGDWIANSVLSPDGKWLATATFSSVVVWDVATGQAIRRFPGDIGARRMDAALAFSPDGKRLAHLRATGYVSVWDWETSREIWRSKNGFQQLICQFSPDGQEIGLSERAQFAFYSLKTGEVTRTLPAKFYQHLSPDGETAIYIDDTITAGVPRTTSLMIGEFRTGQVLTRIGVSRDMKFHQGVAFTADSKTFAVVYENKEIQVRSLPNGTIRATFPLPDSTHYPDRASRNTEYWEYRVGFSTDGRTLLLGNAIGGIHRWDIATKAELPTLKGPPGWIAGSDRAVTGMHTLQDGQTLVATYPDGMIRRWNLRTAEEITDQEVYQGRVRAADSLDGRSVAVADRRGRVDVWDATTGKLVRTIRRDGPAVVNLAIAPDGKFVVAGLSSGVLQFWELPSGQEGKSFRFRDPNLGVSHVMTLLVSPDGRSVYAGDNFGRAQLWDVATGQVRWQGGGDRGAAVAPDGSKIIATLDDNFAALLDTATGAESQIPLPGHQNALGGMPRAVTYAPNGKQVAVADWDGIAIHDAATGETIEQFTAVDPLQIGDDRDRAIHSMLRKEDGNRVHALAFSRDGHWLASGGADKSVRIWEIAAGKPAKEVRRFEGHDANVTYVAFGPDGKTLLSAANDGQVYLWRLDLD